MNKIQLLILLLFSSIKLSGQNNSFQFVNTDIPNFWKAYDLIQSTKDTNQHSTILQREYLDKGSDGLKSLMRVRNYTKSSFLQAMRQYPRFWNSIRKSSLSVNSKIPAIEKSLNSLRILYPEAKPATVYFCMGAFRTNGTIEDNKILIGAEMALTDSTTDISELPENLQTYYKKYKPAETIDLLITHEYIHTQQQLPLDNLLCNSLYEGVAEYLSCLATGKSSTTPSFGFGAANQEKVKVKYLEDLFLPDRMYNWLWGTNNNELKERDLGYYIGYRIAEEYYRKSSNKNIAIHNLIQLDFANDSLVENIVDSSAYFNKTMAIIFSEYENKRPTVTHISPFINGSKTVDSGKVSITVHFSEPLNKINAGIDFGPLGETYCPKLPPEQRVWAADGKSYTITAELLPGKDYQFLINNNFRNEDGIRLKPFLIEFKTKP